MKKLNKVVIIGRTNVGKSTLFNRLSTSVKSMTLDYMGVTRDFISDTVTWKDRSFELIDTGGIDFKKGLDFLTEAIRERAVQVLESSDVVLFVVDGAAGVTAEDQTLARFVHKLKKPTLLLINKGDSHAAQENESDFIALGFGYEGTILISAQHGLGMADVCEGILAGLPAQEDIPDEEPGYKVVLLGKPNVGKSSLMNALLQRDRSLVSEIAGTTREAIRDRMQFYKETIEVVDTAGIRRQRSVDETIEEMMVKTSFGAVRDADIILLLIDAHEAQLAHQELKLASYAFEQGKALIIIRNKHDLVTEDIQEQWKYDTEEYEHLLRKIEVLTISCTTGHNIGKILPLVKEVWERYTHNFSPAHLTMIFKEGLERTPLFHNKHRLKMFSAKQVGIKPLLIRLNVNEPDWFESSQLSFFENLLRKDHNLKSVPVKFNLRRMFFD
jgi:GTP-binding protein